MEQATKSSHPEQLSRSEWESHFQAWKASGLNKTEYCRREGLSYHAFNYWEKRLMKPSPSGPINLIRLDDVYPRDTSLSESSPGSPVRLWINGIRMEIERNISSTELTRLVKALKRV